MTLGPQRRATSGLQDATGVGAEQAPRWQSPLRLRRGLRGGRRSGPPGRRSRERRPPRLRSGCRTCACGAPSTALYVPAGGGTGAVPATDVPVAPAGAGRRSTTSRKSSWPKPLPRWAASNPRGLRSPRRTLTRMAKDWPGCAPCTAPECLHRGGDRADVGDGDGLAAERAAHDLGGPRAVAGVPLDAAGPCTRSAGAPPRFHEGRRRGELSGLRLRATQEAR